VQAVNGVATFSNLSLYPEGTYTLAVRSDPLGVATTGVLQVSPAKATQLEILGPGTDLLAGVAFGITVGAVDDIGHLDPTYNGPVTLSSSALGAGPLGGTLTAMAVDGIAEFAGLTFPQAGRSTIRATASGLLPADSSEFDVWNDRLVVTAQPPGTVAVGASFGLTVSAVNGAGVPDSSYNGPVTITTDSSGGPDATLGGMLTVLAVNGVARFSGLTLDQTGFDALTITGAGAAPATSDAVTVIGMPASHLVLSGSPAAVTAGAGFVLTVSAEDSSGNVDASFQGPVTVSLAKNPAGGVLGGVLTANAVNGVATFSGLTLDAPGSGYSLQAVSDGFSQTSGDFSVLAAGLATRLVITAPPSDVVAGVPFGLVARAEDDFGTPDPTYNGTANLSLAANPRGDTLQGIPTATAVNGVVTFSGLTLDAASDGDTLAVLGTGLPTATTGPFGVAGGAATQLAISGPAGNVVPGLPFAVSVAAQDAFGNVDRDFNGVVALSLSNNPGGAALGGTLTATAVDGFASFPGVTLSGPGDGAVLGAGAAGLAAATSSPFDVTTDQFVVSTQPPNVVTTSTGFGLTVSAVDGSGRLDASYNGPVTVSALNLGPGSPTLAGPSPCRRRKASRPSPAWRRTSPAQSRCSPRRAAWPRRCPRR
jgi:hypothetical protein